MTGGPDELASQEITTLLLSHARADRARAEKLAGILEKGRVVHRKARTPDSARQSFIRIGHPLEQSYSLGRFATS
jgi:hypothetical protein